MIPNVEINYLNLDSQQGLGSYNVDIDEPIGLNDDPSCAATIDLDALALPPQQGKSGQVLFTDGTDPYWDWANSIPLDFGIYNPLVGTVVFTFTGDDITKITTTNSFGNKVVDLSYTGGEVSQIDIDNYGEVSRTITFTKNPQGEITQINIV